VTAFAYDAQRWYDGEVEDDTPRSTPIAPPAHAEERVDGEPWPRWQRTAWVLEPWTAQPPPVVPDEVEMWRARCVLIAAGKHQAVLDAIAAIPDPVQRAITAAQFEFRPTVRRLSPLTVLLQQAAGITDEERDAMFVQAAAL